MPENKSARADRILDAAADLLLRWGYRRVTIDEVAKRAGVGKGTVYLHWRSREALLMAVLLRESVGMFTAVAEHVRRDPDQVRLSALMSALYLESSARPLVLALYTKDTETLGTLVQTSSGTQVQGVKLVTFEEYYHLLREHGLLRADVSNDEVSYACAAVLFGFFTMSQLAPAEFAQPREQEAGMLAGVLRARFEPPRPSKRAAEALAPKIVSLLEDLATQYHELIYRPDISEGG
ncbi:TetR family transcriptional regulator [Herbihabitans rhizosphaerae]|uniref:TetR family transcriptional regulator n=1 Tax=Herbihabitans rhizosphaerae TaxID=1872711 RepID=A0A4Q7KIX9_9PSEU|nr:TetR/AcrR family transcriptional regulator [Herbihabitans rhizosphaerae]RZS36499.1 TetR family transcriptional regulator [Herbihabitans rhizosphaerae]